MAIFLVAPARASAPHSSYVMTPMVGQNSLIAISNPVFYALDCSERDDCTLSDYKDYIRTEYPDIADLLICIWKKESTYGTNRVGDHGKAIGDFQIWVSVHDISQECANDFFCSLDWTAKKIKAGKSYLWTTTKLCQ